jgi:ssDNA-specific exonuclease RecJ
MNTKSIWGNHTTSRWEFNTKPKNSGSTLAEDLLAGKDIKKQTPTEDVLDTPPSESDLLTDIVSNKETSFRENFEILLAASLDLVDGDITLDDFKEIVNRWVV